MFKKVSNNRFLIIALLVGLMTSIALFKGDYFSHHDDLQVMRVFEMRKCLIELQIPCRWVPDMGYGYGYPLFNYYSATPYYLGALFSFVFGYIFSVKLLFLTTIVLASVGTFLLVQELTTNKYAALVASVFYIFTPYRALDIFVRGALAEIFALSLIPLVLYFVFKGLKTQSTCSKVGTTLTLFALLATHNITTLIFVPILFVWIMLFMNKNNLSILKYVALGFLMASFFILPAFFEKDLVQTQNLVNLDLNFRGHFTTLKQLFWDRSWGYGASVVGDKDGISFQVGTAHWLTGVIALLLLLVKQAKRETLYLPVVFFALFVFSAFLSHAQSAFIWERVDIMKYIQFPWRFVGFASLFASFLAGYIVLVVPKRSIKVICAVIILLIVGLNINYFKPERYVVTNDTLKLTGESWELQQKAAMLDYLPITALEPREAAYLIPEIDSGVVANFIKNSKSFSFEVDVQEKALVTVPIFDFPNWQVNVNGEVTAINNDNFLGLISFEVPAGKSVVGGRFGDTKLRTFANALTLVGFSLFIYLLHYEKTRKST